MAKKKKQRAKLKKDGYGDTTRGHYLDALKTFLKWASADAHIVTNPLAGLEKPKRDSEKDGVLTPEQFIHLVKTTFEKNVLIGRSSGAVGMDGQILEEFDSQLDEQPDRLHDELKSDTYCPEPVRQELIPKPGQSDKCRPLGIPTVYGRVCHAPGRTPLWQYGKTHGKCSWTCPDGPARCHREERNA